MKARRFIFPVFLLLILTGMTWVMISNYQRVDELQKAGKQPMTVATPGVAGEDGRPGKSAYQVWRDNGFRGSEVDFLQWLRGDRGRNGRSVTDEDVSRAVEQYCSGGRCDPRAPTEAQVVAALAVVCNGTCEGRAGSDGRDGTSAPEVTPNQIAAQVASYCADGRCRGATGAVGGTGPEGRTPVIGCVVRTVNSLPINYIAWKYTDEADSAYRNLYRVPAWAQADGCVEVTA